MIASDKAQQGCLDLLKAVQQDINKRNIFNILPANNESVLLKACQSVLSAKSVVILTGFQCNYQFDMKAENDGIAGAINLVSSIYKLGNKEKIRLLADKPYAHLLEGTLLQHLLSDPFISAKSTSDTCADQHAKTE